MCYISLYIIYHIYIYVHIYQPSSKKFPLVADGPNTENHSYTLWREQGTLERSALKGMSLSDPSPQGSGNPAEAKAGKSGRVRGDGGQPENKAFYINMINAQMNSETEAACAGPHPALCVCARASSLVFLM